MLGISGGDYGDSLRPRYGQAGILNIQRCFSVWMVGCVVAVKQGYVVADCLKPVGEAFGNEQRAVVIGSEFLGVPV